MKEFVIDRGDVHGYKCMNKFYGRPEYNILLEGLGPWVLDDEEADDLIAVLQELKAIEIDKEGG